jgi:hypothetical protein
MTFEADGELRIIFSRYNASATPTGDGIAPILTVL